MLLLWLALALAPAADKLPEPCWNERVHAAKVCRAKGDEHKACRRARLDRDLCIAEHAGNDPLEGL